MNRKRISDFNLLVEKHNREIYAYLWRMLRDPLDAEDALQESFLRAFRGFPYLKNEDNLRAWFYKIATNVAYTYLKQRTLHENRTAKLDEASSPAFQPNPDQAEIMEAVRIAVESLPQKQRAALVLRNYQGFEYTEIAQILKCSEDTARANVYQALKKLRNLFAEEAK
jgi:RNA polymerase sigma-70 factor (ECF subfamily)